MTEARRGLGRGLGALLGPTDASTQPQDGTVPSTENAAAEGLSATYLEIEPGRITPNPRQPRQIFDEEALAELVHSIRELGLLQPIVVRRIESTDTPFEIVAGERRWRAAQIAGLDRIPAIVRETADDELLREALMENLHRAQLNPLEEAAAYAQLLADFGGTQEELAARVGRSRPQVANTIRLLRLPPAVQRRVASGVLSAGHARALLALEDPAAMERLAERIVAEGLSVRSVEEIVLVGDDGEPRRGTSRRRGVADPEIAALLEVVGARLGDALDTRVRVTGGRSAQSRGRVVIEYADLDDLARIANLIDPA